MRPGYGYAGGRDAHAHENAPAASGIWSMDLGSGEARLVFSLEDASTLGAARARHHKSWFNHLLVSPDGGRLAFLHRWREGRRRVTRMLTIGTDGSQPRVVDPHGSTSHFIWRDPRHIVAWTVQPSSGKGFHVIEDGGGRAEIVHRGLMDRDGHVSFLPGGRFILCDTYADAAGYQDLYLVDTETSRRQGLGSFRQPGGYGGEWRCDLHPRSSPDGRTVAIDSAHSGHGRQIHLLDVSAITGAG
jgi:Tol biopolymer transport system component